MKLILSCLAAKTSNEALIKSLLGMYFASVYREMHWTTQLKRILSVQLATQFVQEDLVILLLKFLLLLSV